MAKTYFCCRNTSIDREKIHFFEKLVSTDINY